MRAELRVYTFILYMRVYIYCILETGQRLRAANFNYQNYDKVVYDILTRVSGSENLTENLLIFKSLLLSGNSKRHTRTPSACVCVCI